MIRKKKLKNNHQFIWFRPSVDNPSTSHIDDKPNFDNIVIAEGTKLMETKKWIGKNVKSFFKN